MPPARRGAGIRLYAFHLFAIFGLAASNILLGFSVLSVPWTGRWRSVPWERYRPLLWPFAAYALATVVAAAASLQPRTSVHGLSELFSLTTLLLALAVVRGERDVRWVANGMIAVAALCATWGLLQFLTGRGGIDDRIRGPFSHYMTFSGILALADLLLLAQLVCGTSRRGAWRWAALALINLALLGSLTRGAWIGVGLGLTALLAIRAPKLLLGYLPGGLLFVMLSPVPLLSRVLSIGDLRDASTYDRLCMASAGLLMIRERPVTGLGLDMIEERYPIYRHPTAPRYVTQHLHNSYIQIAAERGLPALAAFLALFVAGMGRAWRRYRAEGRVLGTRADLHLGILLALFGFAVSGLFEYNWGDTEVQRWVLFLLAAPFCVGPPESEPAEPAPAPSAPISGVPA